MVHKAMKRSMTKMSTDSNQNEVPDISEDGWAFLFLALIFGSEKQEDGTYVFKEENLKKLIDGCDFKKNGA